MPTDTPTGPARRDLLLSGAALTAALGTASLAVAETVPASLKGQSVLITGTSSGFGKLMALDLARRGAKVIASMRRMQGGQRREAVELSEAARAEKLDLSLVEIDIIDEAQVVAGVAEAEKRAGGALDAVINNAGMAFNVPVELGDLQATRLIFETNLFGALRVSQAALPAMRARGRGWIGTVSSQLGRVIIPGVGHYSASKFGVEALFEALAYELAPFGVEVTIIQPGGYPTNIWASGSRNASDILERRSKEDQEAYEQHLMIAGGMFRAGGGSTDPMDVPRAVAEIMAMPPGTRPLRRPVHPNTRATEAINAASAQVQAAALGNGPFAPWYRAVANVG